MNSLYRWTVYATQISMLTKGQSLYLPAVAPEDTTRFRDAMRANRLTAKIVLGIKPEPEGGIRVTRTGKREPRLKWESFALIVAGLKVNESVVFDNLFNDAHTVQRARIGLAQNAHSKAVKVRVEAVATGIKVTRCGDAESIHGPVVEQWPVEIAEPTEVSVISESTHCLGDRACPFPVVKNGMCRQHAFWNSQNGSNNVSPMGSSLSDVALIGA